MYVYVYVYKGLLNSIKIDKYQVKVNTGDSLCVFVWDALKV